MLQVALLTVSISSIVVFAAAMIARGSKRRSEAAAARSAGREAERRYLVEHWADVERVALQTMEPDEVDAVRRRVFGLE